MYLELNLVKTDSIYSVYGKSLARNRVIVNNDTEVITEVIKFIGDNFSIFDSALTDKNLVAKLSNLKFMSIDEFQSLRYILTYNKLDIRYWAISESESDEDIPNNNFEYNIVDYSNMVSGFVPFCTKLLVDRNRDSIAEIYNKIMEMYGLFQGDLFDDGINPIKRDIEVMRVQESTVGFVPADIANHTNLVLEFVKKYIYIIGN